MQVNINKNWLFLTFFALELKIKSEMFEPELGVAKRSAKPRWFWLCRQLRVNFAKEGLKSLEVCEEGKAPPTTTVS